MRWDRIRNYSDALWRIPNLAFFSDMIAQRISSKYSDSTPMLFNTISDAMDSYDNVKMVYYINMTQYFELLELSETTVQHGDNICFGLHGDVCNLQINRLRMQLENSKR